MVAKLRVGLLGEFPDERQIKRNPWNLHYRLLLASKQEGATTVVFASNRAQGRFAELCDRWVQWKPMVPGSQIFPATLPEAIRKESVDILVFNLSATYFLLAHRLASCAPNLVGLVTTPIYSRREITRAGILRLLADPAGSRVHIATPFLISRLTVSHLDRRKLILVTVSARNAERLMALGYPRERIRVVQPPFNLSFDDAGTRVPSLDGAATAAEDKNNQPSFVFLYLGSPTPLRGAFDVVRAFGQVAADYPNARLVLLSRPDLPSFVKLSHKLVRLAERQGCVSRVRVVTDYLSAQEVRHHVLECGVVVLPFRLIPSDSPISVLEAMAEGKAVISTTLDGVPELLTEGRGLLVEPGDLRGLVSAMRSLIGDRGLRYRVGQAAKALVIDEYSGSAHEDGLRSLITSLRG